MTSWLIPFAVMLGWIILVAPLIGVVAAGVSGWTIAMIVILVRGVAGLISIWRYPYRDRGESDLWKYL